jgi:BMFP domain-containing protein YqiC
MSFFEAVFSDPFLFAEFITIISVFIVQGGFFVVTQKRSSILENIFDNPLRLEKEKNGEDSSSSGQLILLQSKSKNEVNQRIKSSINNYLINNQGAAVNYSIIKDIIDREVDGKDDEVTQLIPIPLYLGLSATIIGIIFGLFAMPELASNGNSADLSGIDQLMNGIKLAMTASLSGLIWTIILSSYIYSKSHEKVLRDKNSQLNYLQENLLPELFKEEDAGVLGLKNSIDNFSRMTTDIVDDIAEVTSKLSQNTKAQQQTLERIEEMNVSKISKTNLELFDRLEQNMDSFHEFSQYIDQLSNISEKLAQFSNRTESIDQIANEIQATLHQTQKLSEFLSAHLQELESLGDSAEYAMDISEKRFEEAIEKLTESTAENVQNVQAVSDEIENNFSKIYDQLFNRMEEISQMHVEKFTEAYENSIPSFQKLDHLQELQELERIKLQLDSAFNGRHTNGEKNLNNLEVANKKLFEITSLLEKLEKNTNKLELKAGRKQNIILRGWKNFIKFIKSLFN